MLKFSVFIKKNSKKYLKIAQNSKFIAGLLLLPSPCNMLFDSVNKHKYNDENALIFNISLEIKNSSIAVFDKPPEYKKLIIGVDIKTKTATHAIEIIQTILNAKQIRLLFCFLFLLCMFGMIAEPTLVATTTGKLIMDATIPFDMPKTE